MYFVPGKGHYIRVATIHVATRPISRIPLNKRAVIVSGSRGRVVKAID